MAFALSSGLLSLGAAAGHIWPVQSYCISKRADEVKRQKQRDAFQSGRLWLDTLYVEGIELWQNVSIAPKGPYTDTANKGLLDLDWCMTQCQNKPNCHKKKASCCIYQDYTGKKGPCTKAHNYNQLRGGNFSDNQLEVSMDVCNKEIGHSLAFISMLRIVRKSHAPSGKLPAGYVVLLDDDARLAPDWAKNYQKLFKKFGKTGWDLAALGGGGLKDAKKQYPVRSAAYLMHSSSATHILHTIFKPRVGVLPWSEALMQAHEKKRLKVVVPEDGLFFTDTS